MSDLDKEFEKTIDLLNEKLGDAARALKDANELCKKAGFPSMILASWVRDDLYKKIKKELESSLVDGENLDTEISEKMKDEEARYNLIDLSDLETQLGIAGWSVSSSYC